MNITLEQYRSRIGNFLPSSFSSPTKIVSPRTRTHPFQVPWFIVLVLAAAAASSLILVLQQNPHVIHKYNGPAYNNPPYPCNRNRGTDSELADSLHMIQGFNTLASSAISMISNFQSRYTHGNRKAKGIGICHWNKGPGFLKNKIPEIKQIVNDIHPHIIGISEANLHHDHDQDLVQLDDYVLHTCQTLNNISIRSSRVVVYTHSSLVVKLRPDLMSNDYPSVWLEVGLPRHRKFIVGQTYREWQLPNQPDRTSLAVSEQLTRWINFLDQWERALDTGQEVHLLGDLNINHCNWTTPDLPASNQTSRLAPLITALFTRIIPQGVSQHVVGPTRHWPGQVSTGLDHYFTNRPEKLSAVSSQFRGGSDHMLIHAVRYSQTVKARPRYIRRRVYKNFKPEEFREAVKQLSWIDLYCCDDVENAVKLLTSKLTFILDTMAPIKTIQMRKKYAPWLSPTTLGLMKERDTLQKVASENKNRDDWKKFKVVRNKVNNRLKFEESSWQKKKIEDCGKDSSKVWKSVKGILNFKNSGSPSQLFYNGSFVAKPQEVAEAQNHYFLNKISQIRENMPPPVTDPLSLVRSLMAGRTCSFSLRPVHPDEVEEVVTALSNSSSFGLDLIDTYIIKLVKLEILPALTHIINLSLAKNEFPTAWKKSKIIPLHKKGDTLNPKNYRPVAIIPVFSKILERVVFNQMVEYLTRNQLIHPNHHAYRSHHNTTTALIQLYDGWVESVQAGKIAGVCFLDMSAAFDIVDHNLLLKKLELYGFDQDMLRWISSYLTGRYQAVSIDGCLSKLSWVEHGVPQGSILGPLLYTLFTNELPETIHDHSLERPVEAEGAGTGWPTFNLGCKDSGTVTCYADDTTYSYADEDPDSLSQNLSDKYKVMSDFLVSNQLKLNDEKTKLMVMTTSQKRPKLNQLSPVVINTPTEVIEKSETEKLLGAWLHQDMKWAEHVVGNEDCLVRSLNRRIGALRKVCKVAGFKNRKMIADGIFMSKLVYLIPLWGACAASLLKSLQTLQNKAARAVTKLDWNSPTTLILQQCGWLSVNQLSVYHTVILAHKVMQARTPKYLYSKFNTNYQYKTRQATSGLIRCTRTPELDIARDSFCWRATELYNRLPVEIRNMKTLMQFRENVKSWVKQNIEITL